LANAVADATGLPIRFVALLARFVGDDGGPDGLGGLPWLPLTRQLTTPLEPRPHGLRRRSSVV
jgi:hypothetical protein